MNVVLLSEIIYPVFIQVFKDILKNHTDYTLKTVVEEQDNDNKLEDLEDLDETEKILKELEKK